MRRFTDGPVRAEIFNEKGIKPSVIINELMLQFGRSFSKIEAAKQAIADYNKINQAKIDLDPIVKLAATVPEDFETVFETSMNKIKEANWASIVYNEESRKLDGFRRMFMPGTNIEIIEDPNLKHGQYYWKK